MITEPGFYKTPDGKPAIVYAVYPETSTVHGAYRLADLWVDFISTSSGKSIDTPTMLVTDEKTECPDWPGVLINRTYKTRDGRTAFVYAVYPMQHVFKTHGATTWSEGELLPVCFDFAEDKETPMDLVEWVKNP